MKPTPILTNNKVMTTGNEIKSAETNISAPQAVILPSSSCVNIDFPMGNKVKDSSNKPNTIKCPPIDKKTKVPRMVKNCEITGTLPNEGSTILAMDSPIEPETACPATTMAALEICMIKAITKPINNWLTISLSPSAVTGSMRGMSMCKDKKMVRTIEIDRRIRRLTARIEKIEENAKKAEMRSMGQIMA